ANDQFVIEELRAPGKPQLRAEIVPVRVRKLIDGDDLCIGQPVRTDDQVPEFAVSGNNRPEILPSKTEVEGQIRAKLPIVLHEEAEIGISEWRIVRERSAVRIGIDRLENGRIVGEVPWPDKGIKRTRAAGGRVVVQIQAIFAAKPEALCPDDLGQNIAKMEL